MKRMLILLSIALGLSLVCVDTYAIDFAKEESKYIKLCSSSSLSSSEQKTCKSFNNYLKEKNESLKDEIKNTEKDISNTNKSLTEAQKDYDAIVKRIQLKEDEIAYIEKSITNSQKNIKEKKELLRDRLYKTQSLYNSPVFVVFLFESQSISDFFSRISSLTDITAYETSLIEELKEEEKDLETQKKSLAVSKSNLVNDQANKVLLQNKYKDLLTEQNQDLADTQDASQVISAAQKKIDANLTALYQASLKEQSTTNAPQIVNPSNENTTELGLKIANLALSKQGCRYWWGAPGGGYGDPESLNSSSAKYFDCSGLVCWAHRQAGLSMVRTTASGYSKMGKKVDYDDLQIGDVITFQYSGSVEHIGIYVGIVDGKASFVNALGAGSGTRGQYPNQCVRVDHIEKGSTWYKRIYNCRRLY